MTVTPTRRDIAKFGAGLGAAAAISGLPTRAAEAFLRFGGAGGTGGGGGTIPAVTINNFSGTAAPVGTPVRFYHVFKDGDVPAGHFIQVTDGGGNVVPTTFARRNLSSQTSPFTGQPQGYLGVDCICRTARSIAGNGSDTFTLTVMSGSWPDTLPAGKTVANIITDLNTNFVYSATWTNLTQPEGPTNEGNWEVDSATGFAGGSTPAASGYYRCVAEGPTCADFIVYMPLYLQGTPATKHASMRARLYMTAHLNPSTGAVEFVSGQIWARQGDYNIVSKHYRAQIANFINGVKINGWGGTVGDGRTFTFTSSAVNTTAGTISLPGNLFVQGHLVQFSTTGTLPGGLSPATDYFVCPTAAGASTVYVYQFYDGPLNDGGSNGRSAVFTPSTGNIISLTSGGTGTHTVQAFSDWGYWAQTPLVNNQGTWDWLTPSGVMNYQLHAVQDTTYYFKSNKVGRRNHTTVPANTTDNFPSTWSPGTNIALNPPAPNEGGANKAYGAPWSNYAAMRYLEPNDLNGYVQTCRTTALGQTAMTVFLYDPLTHRQVALDGAPDPSYPPLLQNSDICNFGSPFATNPPTPVGSAGVLGNPLQSGTHLWMTTHPCYLYDGGQPLLDLILEFTNSTLAQKDPSNTWSNRQMEESVGGTILWTTWPNGESRSDAWKANYYIACWQVAPTEGPEATYPDHAYVTQIITNAVAELAYLRSASSMGTNWASLGYFDWSNFTQGAPGWVGCTGLTYNADLPFIENLYSFFQQSSWMHDYMICPLWQPFAAHIATGIVVQYGGAWPNLQFNMNQWYGGPMPIAPDAPGVAGQPVSNAAMLTTPDIWPIQWNQYDGIIFGEDGQTCVMLLQAEAPPIINKDRIKFWNQSGNADSPFINVCTAPSGVTMYQWYYVQNVVAGTYGNQGVTTFTLSEDAAGTIPVTWLNANTQTTLGAAITSTSQTGITLAAPISTPIHNWYVSSFTGSVSGTTLTVDSGSLAGAIAIGDVLDGSGVPAGTYIVSGSGLNWTLSQSATVSDRALSTFNVQAIISAYISGTSLTVVSTIAGTLPGGGNNCQIVTPFASIAPATFFTSGGPPWTVNNSQTIGSSGSPVTMFVSNPSQAQMHIPAPGAALTCLNIAKLGTGWGAGMELLSITQQYNTATMTAAVRNGPLSGDGVAARGAYNTTAQTWANGSPVTVYRLCCAIFEVQSNLGSRSATFAYPNTSAYDPAAGVPYPLQARMAAGYAAYLGLIPRSIYDKINAIFTASGNSFGPANSVYLDVADPSA